MSVPTSTGRPPVRAGDLLICGQCHGLRGQVPDEPRGVMQLCACTPREVRAAQPSFRGDHNTYAELCRCCGEVLLPSGSRWSVWFCRECAGRVAGLNRGAGRCIVPIGAHSMMNGVSLRGAVTEPQVELFVRESNGLFASMDELLAHAQRVVVRNLVRLGFPAAEHVPLGSYLRAAGEAPLTSEAAFGLVVEWLRGA